MLMLKMYIVAPNGGVHIAAAFLRPKIAIATTEFIEVWMEATEACGLNNDNCVVFSCVLHYFSSGQISSWIIDTFEASGWDKTREP